ncbi:MAG TPA: hypothetical protein VIY52_20280 [Streptosporangiaceae bacterium]
MWGRRKKRQARLPRQLALGMLQDAMGRVEERQGESEQCESEQASAAEPSQAEAAPAPPPASAPAPAPPPAEKPPFVPQQPGSTSRPDDARTTPK